MAPHGAFQMLKKKWKNLFGSGRSRPDQPHHQLGETSAPRPVSSDMPVRSSVGNVPGHYLPSQQAPCHPATTWLLRTSAHGPNNVPIASQAALHDVLQKMPDKVAVMRVFTPPLKASTDPPKSASPQPIEAWCSALHLSGSLQSLLCAHFPSDYTAFIQALVKTSSPGLHDALVQCGQRAWQAQQATTYQSDVIPHMAVTVPIQGLEFGLTLIMTPMLIKVSKATYQPAVFIEHLVEHHEATLEQQIRYKDMLLSRAPAILTICDLQGNVLHQNAASIQYAGNRTPLLMPASSTARPAYNYLEQAMQHDLERLDELLEDIDMGCEWSAGCIKVPASLQDNLSTGERGSARSARSVLGRIDFTGTASAFGVGAGRTWGQDNMQDFMTGTMPITSPTGRSKSLDIQRNNPQRSAVTGEHLAARARRASVMPPPDSVDPTLTHQLSIGVKPAQSRLAVLMKGNVTNMTMSTSKEGSNPQLMTTGSSLNDDQDGRIPVAWQEMATQDDYWMMMGGDPASQTNNHVPGGTPPHVLTHNILNSKSEPAPVHKTNGHAGWHGNEKPLTSWHEIKAWPTVDPTTGATLVVISQVDVTERREAEMRTAQVSEACVSLLELMFPRHVIEHLTLHTPLQPSVESASVKPDPGSLGGINTLDQLATKHECVTLFFCDIVGFTTMSKEVEPVQVMQFLNSLYSAYDQLVDEFGVYKVETVGDCYVVAGGLMTQDEEGFACVDKEGRNDGTSHALAVYRFAQAVLRVAANTPMPHNGQPVQIRIGLHSGPITSGIIGHRMPKFCLFGDSMNTCSRMETTAPCGSIHLSQATYELLAEQQAAEGLVCTGGVEVKGKGRMVTYVYTPPAGASMQLSRGACSSAAEAHHTPWKQPGLDDYAAAQASAVGGLLAPMQQDGEHRSTEQESVPDDAQSAPTSTAWESPKLWRPTATRATGLSSNQQAFLLQPSKHMRSLDYPDQLPPHNVHVGISAGNLGNRSSRGERGNSHPTSSRGERGNSHPTSFQSASPSANLLHLLSALQSQQHSIHRQSHTTDDRENRSRSSALLLSTLAPRSQNRNSSRCQLATVLSYVQLGEQQRSSSSNVQDLQADDDNFRDARV